MLNTELIRLLKIYHLSVAMGENKFHLIRKGFEMILMKFMRTVRTVEIAKLFPTFLSLTFETNLSKIECKDFGLTLSHGVARLRSHRISQNLRPAYLKFLLATMTSTCDVKSFIAACFLAIIIDCHDNIDQFSSPMIFHEYTNYNIKIELEIDVEARIILEEYREMLEMSIIAFIKAHSMKTENLNSIYSLMCIIISNLPCGFTVVFIVCILINIQKSLIIENQIFDRVHLNHLHSLIASIMTLLCWVTRAKSLTKYIHGIVNLRYDSAPHLNPPLNHFYEYAEHHVLNHNQELFFNSWELRYCLWKRFRLSEELLPHVAISNDYEQKSKKLRKKRKVVRIYRNKKQEALQVYRIKHIASQPMKSESNKLHVGIEIS